MGYVYDSVVVALGGKSLVKPTKEGVALSSWSPNTYKRLAIVTDGILIEYHGFTPRTRVIPFDMVKVSQDLASGGKYKNPLRPIYEFKALSCLEEVIVSESLVTEKMVNTYLSTIIDSHRLRAIGVVPTNVKVSNIEETLNKLNSSPTSKQILISSLIQNSKVIETNNELYYTKYYLRPTLYNLDRKDGQLRKYFDSVKKQVSLEKGKEDARSLLISYIDYDRKNLEFWGSVVTFLSNTDNRGKYLNFYSALKKWSMADSKCYLGGLKEYYRGKTDDSLYRIYKTLGYLDIEGSSSPSPNSKGFLRSVDGVVNNSYRELLLLIKDDKEGSLASLKFPKGSSRVFILTDVLKVLNSELTGTENKKVKTEPRKGNESQESYQGIKDTILSVLPESLMVSLFDLWESLQGDFRETSAKFLTAKGTDFGLRFSEQELKSIGLVRHAETLALLGYCGGNDSLINLTSLSFSSGLDTLCLTVSRGSLAEFRSRSWESLSDTEKCNYIGRRL